MRTSLTSSWLDSAIYDPDRRRLDIFLLNGRAYRFASVPYSEFAELSSATSPGTYFDQNIKSKYDSERIA